MKRTTQLQGLKHGGGFKGTSVEDQTQGQLNFEAFGIEKDVMSN
jgi:hypothetical protein